MDKITKISALCLLGLMFVLMFFSSLNDSATFDEVAHIPAGYSYLTLRDYRINPEHPPLIKDLSAVPLLFLNLNFPIDTTAWTELINGRQWDMGKIFLYNSGNDPDKILRFSRLPIMIIAVILGWLIFKWSSRYYGNKVGLLTLFLYSMSPTIIAHSRYVTTDTGAAFGFFIAVASFINFLTNQTKKNLVIAGLAFGIAQLIKFSALILVPLFLILAILWVILKNYKDLKKIIKDSLRIIGKIVILGLISLIIIWGVYWFHIINYPLDRQIDDVRHVLSSDKARPFADIVIWFSKKPALRPLSEYLFGVFMVFQRAGGGNNAYFMGEVSSSAWPSYFPLLYLFKEHLAFHILTIIALFLSIKNIIQAKNKKRSIKRAIEWMRDNFVITASLALIFIYVAQAVTGNLNIGIRHILPILPFIYLIISRQIVKWGETTNFIKYPKKYAALTVIMLWIFTATIISTPYYLSYYNQLGGGIYSGYRIATDSNYDWGQDLKRLKTFVEKNNIDKIAVDYFGGGSPEYYFKEKYEPWWSAKGPLPNEIKWLAVSVNTITGAQAKPIKEFQIKPEDTYWWLKEKEPYARAGSSIFVYKF